MLLGAIGVQEVGTARTAFTIGAMSASTLWFATVGYGARLLALLCANSAAWRVLEGLIALVMCAIAISLLR